METETANVTALLETAWRRYAQLDALSVRRSRAYQRLHFWITILGVLAVLFAILTAVFFSNTVSLAGLVLKILLVSTPLIASGLAAIGTRAFSNGDWLTTRAAAEEYLTEIYFYRTILQKQKARDAYLDTRINEIQKQLHRVLGAEREWKPFGGQIPPYYNATHPNSDPGFSELNGDEYFRVRLADQLRWHIKKVNGYQRERTTLTVLVLTAGAVGIFLAALTLDGPFSIWVGLTAAITAAFVSWQQFRNLDAIIKNYNKIILELTPIYDHWINLEPEERTEAEFYSMVRRTEEALRTQHTEWNKSMQEALESSHRALDQEASLIDRVVQESVESAQRTKQMMRDGLVEFGQEMMQQAAEKVVK